MQWTMICALVSISWTGKMLQRGSLTMLRINTLLGHTEYGPIHDIDYCPHYHVKNLFGASVRRSSGRRSGGRLLSDKSRVTILA